MAMSTVEDQGRYGSRCHVARSNTAGYG